MPHTTPSKARALRIPWNVLALAVAVVAILVAILVPRPFATGPTVAHRAIGGPITIGTGCTHYPGAEVTLAAPGRGTVVVSATVGVGIRHNFSVRDVARIVVAASSTDCNLDNYTAFLSVPATLPTDASHFEAVPLLRPFSVPGAGLYTFYVNGIVDEGADPYDRFDSASLVASFYPA